MYLVSIKIFDKRPTVYIRGILTNGFLMSSRGIEFNEFA